MPKTGIAKTRPDIMGLKYGALAFSLWWSKKFHTKTPLLSPPNKHQYHRHDIGTTYSQKDLPSKEPTVKKCLLIRDLIPFRS